MSKGSREFIAYFVARQSAWTASAVDDTAIAWQVYGVRHQPFDLALVGLILFVPQLLLAIPAGLIADHLDRRAVCIATAIGNVIGSGLFLWLALINTHSLAMYYGAIAFTAVAYALGAPAQRALLASIVTGERYLRASAFVSSIAQVTVIGGPALAGLLIAVSPALAFAAALAFNLIALIGFFFLKARAPQPLGEGSGAMWGSVLEGLRFITTRKIILGAISLDLFAVLFGGATALLPIYATQILHVGATGFGILRAAPAVGAAGVAAWLVRRPIERHGARWLFWSIAGFGVSTIVFGLSHTMLLSLIALAFTGAFDMVSMVIRNALTQLGVPEAMRGRIGAVENIFIGASNELGTFESGTVAAWLGPIPSVVIGGCATLVVIALWAGLFPELRRFDRLSEQYVTPPHA